MERHAELSSCEALGIGLEGYGRACCFSEDSAHALEDSVPSLQQRQQRHQAMQMQWQQQRRLRQRLRQQLTKQQ